MKRLGLILFLLLLPTPAHALTFSVGCGSGVASSVTRRVEVLGWGTLPDASGNVFFEPYAVKATNDQWLHGQWVFADTSTRDKLYGAFSVPKDYVATTTNIIIVWTS